MRLDEGTIVVTGGTGFLGHYMCDELVNNGATVVRLGRAYCDLRNRPRSTLFLTIFVRPQSFISRSSLVESAPIKANRDASCTNEDRVIQ